MSAEDMEQLLATAIPGGAAVDLRTRVLRAMHAELQRSSGRVAWRRAASIAALVLVSIMANLLCGAYDRRLAREILGARRTPRVEFELRADVQQLTRTSDTAWVHSYIHRFDNL